MRNFLTALVMLITTISHSQSWQWAHQAGGQSWDEGRAIHCSDDGFVYITGRYMWDGIFGSDTIQSVNDTRDIYVAKYDTTGNHIWAVSAGGLEDGGEHGSGIATDGAGGVYVTGYFGGLATFDTITVIANSSQGDAFLAKYNTDGQVQWVKHFHTGTGTNTASTQVQIEIDDQANIYLLGRYQGVFPSDTVVFDGDTLTLEHENGIYLAKFDSNGSKQWISTAEGTSFTQRFALSTDGNGNSFIAGHFSDSAYFENDTIISPVPTTSDIFVASYDPNGNYLWANVISGNGNDRADDITAVNGNVYVSGRIWDSLFFPMDTMIVTPEKKNFIARYDYSGNLIWADHVVGSDRNRIGSDDAGNIFFASTFDVNNGPINIAGTTLTPTGWADIYVVRMDSMANYLEVAHAQSGSNAYNQIGEMDVDQVAGVYLTGFFTGNSTFGLIPLNSVDPGSNQIFLAKAQFHLSALDISEHPNHEISIIVYPNPSTGQYFFNVESEGTVQLEILNQLGNHVLTTEFSKSNFKLDLSHLPSGIYFVRIQIADQFTTTRLVRQ